jgi:F-type H+/Na+-transporting ATPase subunit alpha
VLQVGGGIARVSGLPERDLGELVRFPGGVLGLAVNLEPTTSGVILLGDSDRLSAGAAVTATGREADAPVGEACSAG